MKFSALDDNRIRVRMDMFAELIKTRDAAFAANLTVRRTVP
jgi:hypothetical protein